MKEVQVVIEHAGGNLSAYVEGVPIITTGNTIREVKDNILEAIELYLDACRDENIKPAKVFESEYRLSFVLDATTFINYYSSIFTKSALSRITGINERQLWRYAAGKNIPRKRQLEKIQNGILNLTEEFSGLRLV